ncbi:MAG: oligosaccharide flippase family protein [Bacteroidales bacterium]|nr:oligosaccharide flippase family protein [Bacteroidales bacterium]
MRSWECTSSFANSIISSAIKFLNNSFNFVPRALLGKKFEFKYIGIVRFITVTFTKSFMIITAVLGCSYLSLMIPLVIQSIFKYILIERRIKYSQKTCECQPWTGIASEFNQCEIKRSRYQIPLFGYFSHVEFY